MKELLPKNIPKNTDPWRYATNHGYELEKDIKRPHAKILSNTQIARIHLIPRSYDQRVKTELHLEGYKLTSNSIGYFGEVDEKFYTMAGRKTLEKGK